VRIKESLCLKTIELHHWSTMCLVDRTQGETWCKKGINSLVKSSIIKSYRQRTFFFHPLHNCTSPKPTFPHPKGKQPESLAEGVWHSSGYLFSLSKVNHNNTIYGLEVVMEKVSSGITNVEMFGEKTYYVKSKF
jgi:hypothetical protein